MRTLLVPALALPLLCASGALAQAASNAKLTWGPAPAAFPAGAKMAVVSGDPTKAGPFVIQLALPDGYKIAPHTHPTDEQVDVIKGTFVFATGKTWDQSAMKEMPAGASGKVPAEMPHYAAAKGATVVQITSTGPFAITYVNKADDPRNKKTTE